MVNARTTMPALLALALLTTNQHTSVQAAQYRTISSGVVGLYGPIEEGDSRKLKNILANGVRINSPLRLLVLEGSNGGHTTASMEMATVLNQNRIDTRVTGKCWSACVTIFAGGFRRSSALGAEICVHSARDPDTAGGAAARENDNSYETTIELSRFLYTMGAPWIVLGKLVGTPPSRLTCLTPEDLMQWKVEVH